MKKRFPRVLFFCWVAFPALLFAQDTVKPRIDIIGSAAIEEGQFIKGYYTYETNGNPNSPYHRDPLSYRPWVNDQYAQVGIRAMLNSHFSMVICPQIKLWNDTWDWTKMYQDAAPHNPFIQHMTVSLVDAEGIARFGSSDGIAFTAAAGVFPFKYNEEAKNLGEYLFRTGEHPAYIQTSFDDAYATLTGIRLNTEVLNRLSLDVLLTQETQIIPINDWSLSIVAGYKVPKVLDIGAGIMFDRLIPVNPRQAESPISSATQDSFIFYTSSGARDTLNWGGTKVMAHASFDVKGILPPAIAGIFGKEDGKIYAEAAILGLKNTTAYKKNVVNGTTTYVVDSSMNFYSTIGQRIPRMIGFNIPVFNLLDFLSIEVEYCGWPYSPSLYNYEGQLHTLPQPVVPQNTYQVYDSATQSYTSITQNLLHLNGNNWKWSLNVRKTLWGHLAIIGQVAKDHTRHDVYYSAYGDPEEVFIQPGNWGWWCKLQYSL